MVLQAASRIREGANIHFALKQTHYFSPLMLSHLLMVKPVAA